MLDEKTAWTLAAGGAAVAGAIAARKVLRLGWRIFVQTDPPDNPADPTVSWQEALVWTALTGAVVGVARLLAQRAASSGWERATGHSPPY
jgi:hypothetical protein